MKRRCMRGHIHINQALTYLKLYTDVLEGNSLVAELAGADHCRLFGYDDSDRPVRQKD